MGCGLCPGFAGKWEVEKEKLAGKDLKISFSPVSAFAGEKKLHSAVQNGTVQFFFFLEKENKIWK
jgi:TRAP-type C4-dicarboxylate transport system substrate-binding protein